MQEQRIEVIESGYAFPREADAPQSMYDAQIKYFLECIEKNQTPVPGGLEGLINMKIVDAAYESSRTGNVVAVN